MAQFRIVAITAFFAVSGCNSDVSESRTERPNEHVDPSANPQSDAQTISRSALAPVPTDPAATSADHSHAPRFTYDFFGAEGDDPSKDPSILLSDAAAAMLRRTIRERPIDFDMEFLEKSLPLGAFECDGEVYDLHYTLLVSVREPRKAWTNRRLVRLSEDLVENPTLDGASKAIAEFAHEEAIDPSELK